MQLVPPDGEKGRDGENARWEREFQPLTTEQLWRIVIAGRRSRYAHDNRRAKLAARKLVEREMPRVRAFVASFRFPDKPWLRVEREDRNELAQLAFIEVLALLEAFRGEHLPQFYKAIRPCVGFVCMRFLSREFKSHTRESLDAEVVELAAEQADRDEIDEIDDRDAVERITADIPWDGPREVVRLTFLERLSSEQIAERLGIGKVNNVDVYRRRGLKWLREHRPELRERIAG